MLINIFPIVLFWTNYKCWVTVPRKPTEITTQTLALELACLFSFSLLFFLFFNDDILPAIYLLLLTVYELVGSMFKKKERRRKEWWTDLYLYGEKSDEQICICVEKRVMNRSVFVCIMCNVVGRTLPVKHLWWGPTVMHNQIMICYAALYILIFVFVSSSYRTVTTCCLPHVHK